MKALKISVTLLGVIKLIVALMPLLAEAQPPPGQVVACLSSHRVCPDGTVLTGTVTFIDTDGDGSRDVSYHEFQVDADGDGTPEKVTKTQQEWGVVVLQIDDEEIEVDRPKGSTTVVEENPSDDGTPEKRTTIEVEDTNGKSGRLDDDDTKKVTRESDNNNDGDFDDPGEKQAPVEKKFYETLSPEVEENLSSLASDLDGHALTLQELDPTLSGIVSYLAGALYSFIPAWEMAESSFMRAIEAFEKAGLHELLLEVLEAETRALGELTLVENITWGQVKSFFK